MKNSILVFSALILLTFSCQNSKKVSLGTSITGSVWHNNGELIAEAMAKYEWQIEVLHGPEYVDNLGRNSIENKQLDFAITPNNRIMDQGNIRAVAPLIQEAMLFIYRDNGTEYNSLEDLISGNRVLLPLQSAGASDLIREVFSTLEIEDSDYTSYSLDLDEFNLLEESWKNTLDSIDVLVSFSQLNNPKINEIISLGWKIFPLGDVNRFEKKSSLIDALCIKYPWAFPIIIPKNVFGNQQLEPVYTLGVQSLLITNRDSDSEMIYEFLEDFYNSLPAMSQKNVAFAQINENYKRASISYPLHDGVIRYMNRDDPNFIEKYAELFALFITLSVLVAGIINGYLKRLKQTKKDRIDVYYDEILAATGIEQLNSIRMKAVNQMQAERLLADETFVIFLQLYEQRKNELM